MDSSDRWSCGKCGAENDSNVFEDNCSFCSGNPDGKKVLKNLHVQVLSCGHTTTNNVNFDTFKRVAAANNVIVRKAGRFMRAVYTNNVDEERKCKRCSVPTIQQ